MPRTSDLRERILSTAEEAVLAKGFGATSIDELIEATGISKSGFFYHFRDKNQLARALLERYRDRDEVLLDDVFARGRELSEDPLQAFLIGLKLLAEMMGNLPERNRGCLVATYCYQERLFDRDVRELNRAIVLMWRSRFRALLDGIRDVHEPRQPVDLDELADQISSVIEGGLVLSRALGDPSVLPGQILLLRRFIQLLFSAAPPPASA